MLFGSTSSTEDGWYLQVVEGAEAGAETGEVAGAAGVGEVGVGRVASPRTRLSWTLNWTATS